MSKVVVIGAGPAGITASIYLKRAGIELVLIEKMMPGGKISLTHKIDNYPGFSSIGGSDLANQMMNQLMENNIEISIFNYSLNKDDHFPKTSVLCYSLIENDERIDIVDIIFNKDEIETIEIYKYMTLKELYNDKHFKILEMF